MNETSSLGADFALATTNDKRRIKAMWLMLVLFWTAMFLGPLVITLYIDSRSEDFFRPAIGN